MAADTEHAAPAGDALERAVAQARTQLEAEDSAPAADPPTPDTPAASAQDAPAPTTPPAEGDETDAASAPEDDEAKAGEPSPEDRPQSRRAKAKALEQDIEARYKAQVEQLKAEFDARLAAVEQRTAAPAPVDEVANHTRQLRELVKNHKEGTWEATEALAKWTAEHIVGDGPDGAPPKVLATVYDQGRKAMLKDLTQDYPKLKDLPGVDGDAYARLLKAPNIPDLVAASLEIGKAGAAGALESKDEEIALLKGQVESLKGKLAGKAPSPEGAGGAKAPPGLPDKARSFEDAVRMAWNTHGQKAPI